MAKLCHRVQNHCKLQIPNLKKMATSLKYRISIPTIQYIIPSAKFQSFSSSNMRFKTDRHHSNLKLITTKIYNFVGSLTNSWRCYRRKGKFNTHLRDQARKGNSLISYITSVKFSVDLRLFQLN